MYPEKDNPKSNQTFLISWEKQLNKPESHYSLPMFVQKKNVGVSNHTCLYTCLFQGANWRFIGPVQKKNKPKTYLSI